MMCNPLKCLRLHCVGRGSQSRAAEPRGAGLVMATHPFFFFLGHMEAREGSGEHFTCYRRKVAVLNVNPPPPKKIPIEHKQVG